MKEYFRKIGYRRIIEMFAGILLIGIGISIFKLAGLGNDPNSAMVMAIADKMKISFGTMLLATNAVFFIFEIFWCRKLVGLGTFVNWACIGYISTFCTGQFSRFITTPENLYGKILIMVIGVLVLCLGASLYQTARLGIAPYDCISLFMAEKTRIKYVWCRIITDSFCTAVCIFFGGIVGLGTLVCSLGLGPVINFFNRNVSEKIVNVSKS